MDSKDTIKQRELPSHTENASTHSDSQQQEKSSQLGRVIGGKYTQEISDDESSFPEHGPLQHVDIDMPLTLTETTYHNDNQVIVLDFRPGDLDNPFNWSGKKKGFLSLLLCMMTLFIGLATTAYSSGISRMCAEFGVSEELGQLGLFTFNFTCALAPLFLAPFCELAGRKIIYVGGYVCFAIMFIGLSLGQNIATIIICRALLGLFGCIGTILVGGTFGDMYTPEDRAIPMASFS